MDVCLLLVLSGQIEVSATGRSLVQSSLTDCDVSCVIWKPHEWGGPGPLRAVAPKTNKNIVARKMYKVKIKNTLRRTWHNITSSIKNLTWTGLGFNRSLRGHRPAIKGLRRGKAFPTKQFQI